MSEGVLGKIPDGCPPDGHVPAQGTFYRLGDRKLAIGDTPIESDWLLPVAKRGEHFKNYDVCKAFAYSLFNNLDDLVKGRAASAWARKKSIARVELEPSLGVVLATHSTLAEGHQSWWPNSEDRLPEAVVIEPGDLA